MRKLLSKLIKQDQRYFSVTEITRDSSSLAFYTPAHAARGNAIHDLCFNLLTKEGSNFEDRYSSLRGEEFENIYDRGSFIANQSSVRSALGFTLPEEHIGYATSFLNWMAVARPYPVVLEKVLIDSTYKISGKPDYIGMMRTKNGLGLIDWKTSIAKARNWKLQVVAYAYLLLLNGIKVNWAATLRIKKDGTMAIFDPVVCLDGLTDSEEYKKTVNDFFELYEYLLSDYENMEGNNGQT
jgi:hypothetical protein